MEIEIPVSKFRMLLVAIGSLAFVVASVPLILLGVGQGIPQLVGWILFGLVDAAFFGSGFLFAVRKLIGNSPALRIDSRGIDDQSSLLTAGFVPWSEIASWHIARIGMQQSLCLVPVDLEAFLARQPLLRRILMKQNMILVKSPFVISTVALPLSLQDLTEIVEQSLDASHQNGAALP